MDGFDYYATAELARKWTNVGGAQATVQGSVVRTGDAALRMQLSSSGVIDKTIDAQATWIFGAGIRVSALPSNNTATVIAQWRDSGTVQCGLILNSNGTLRVVRSTSTDVTDGTSSFVLSADTWLYIEWKVTIANSIGAGTCEVRVNGTTIITVATGQDLQATGNSTADELRIVNVLSGAAFMYVDDLYLFDGTGSENIDFAGDSKIVSLRPDGNGATSNFTGSDADSVDNHLHVDETTVDDDTSFVESNTVAHIDLYTFGDLPESPTAIHAVGVNSQLKKTDAGSRTMRNVTRPVATNFFGSSLSPSNGSYENFAEIYDLNPETSAAWTEALLNASEFGVNIEA